MESGKKNCDTCKRLIRLCGGLNFFPQDPEVQLLLVERLHKVARDHQHAKLMIDRWLDTNTGAPKPADFVTLAAEVGTDDRAGLPDPCDECKGSGGYWAIGPDGATRCNCARGGKAKVYGSG